MYIHTYKHEEAVEGHELTAVVTMWFMGIKNWWVVHTLWGEDFSLHTIYLLKNM